jgi:perosamine synthetase
MTSGGGGAILTDDDELAKKAKHITTTAKIPHKWEFNHDMVGFNYRMPALNAALGLAQLEQIDYFVAKKRTLALKYKSALKGLDELIFFEEPSYAKSNYWLNAIILNKGHESLREHILEITNNNNMMTRPIWTLLNKLEMFKECPKMDLSVSESLEQRVINIPSSAWL